MISSRVGWCSIGTFTKPSWSWSLWKMVDVCESMREPFGSIWIHGKNETYPPPKWTVWPWKRAMFAWKVAFQTQLIVNVGWGEGVRCSCFSRLKRKEIMSSSCGWTSLVIFFCVFCWVLVNAVKPRGMVSTCHLWSYWVATMDSRQSHCCRPGERPWHEELQDQFPAQALTG